MSLDLNAIRERAERYARAMGPGGEKAWVAGLLAADVPALLAEIARLTDSEDSRVVVLEAENTRLKEELHQLANDLDAAGEALKATAEGYRFSADAQARMAEMDRLRAENRMLRTKSTRLESENKLLRDELGSARDWEAWERKEAEIKKLRAECVEYDEANTDLGIALAEARAELDRTKPVVDAAEEWYAAFEYEELDEDYSAEERVLFNTIKANPSCPSCGPGGCAGHTRKPSEVDSDSERYMVWLGSCAVHPEAHWQWCCEICPASRCFPASSPADVRAEAERHVATQHRLPVCADCGHRHRWGGECADHGWGDTCPYDAGADCEGDPLRCPTCDSPAPNLHPAMQHEGEVQVCGDQWHGEAICSRCGGRDGTHTVRDCAGHTKAVAEKPTGGISEKTMSALANYARATGMIPSEAAAEGLSSTDTTAVERG